MDSRTFSYIQGRFKDYYRQEEITLPPNGDEREWGYIPFDENGETYMIRHKSLPSLGGINQFTAREGPRHLYFSSSKYETPGIPNMNDKGWNSADLIFDIDADHLSSVDEDTTPYDEMLAEGKKMLQKLVEVLTTDLGFEDVQVVFSGGRGYHVHIRDESVQEMSRSARNEIVDYLTATNVEFEHITTNHPFEFPVPQFNGLYPQSAGWGKKYHEYLQETLSALHDDIHSIYDSHEESKAADEVAGLLKDEYNVSNIGTKRAKTLVRVFTDPERYAKVRAGNLTAAPTVKILAKQLLQHAREDLGVEIDEPVTTDINRLIRLPGSLHGGSGLRVTRIPADDVSGFEPLVDAIPDIFTNHEVKIEVEEPVTSYVGGEVTEYEAGEHTISEYEAVHLLCREDAIKLQEDR